MVESERENGEAKGTRAILRLEANVHVRHGVRTMNASRTGSSLSVRHYVSGGESNGAIRIVCHCTGSEKVCLGIRSRCLVPRYVQLQEES